jgi:RimJ/RimL family protein N-acetyltransferase
MKNRTLASFAHKPVLTGERALLRPFAGDDADAMAEIIKDPEVIRYTFEPSSELTLERLRAWYGSRGEQDDRLDLAVTDRATGAVVGEVVLYDVDQMNHNCTFRTLIGPAGRGRGLGTEATRLIVGYGFERIGLHRIQLDVYTDNHRACRVYEKVGFTAEGVRREVQLREGTWRDELVMSILSQEWNALSERTR